MFCLHHGSLGASLKNKPNTEFFIRFTMNDMQDNQWINILKGIFMVTISFSVFCSFPILYFSLTDSFNTI